MPISATTHPVWLGAKLPGSKPTDVAKSHLVKFPPLQPPFLPGLPPSRPCILSSTKADLHVQLLPTVNYSSLCPRCPNIFNYIVAYLIMHVNN